MPVGSGGRMGARQEDGLEGRDPPGRVLRRDAAVCPRLPASKPLEREAGSAPCSSRSGRERHLGTWRRPPPPLALTLTRGHCYRRRAGSGPCGVQRRVLRQRERASCVPRASCAPRASSVPRAAEALGGACTPPSRRCLRAASGPGRCCRRAARGPQVGGLRAGCARPSGAGSRAGARGGLAGMMRETGGAGRKGVRQEGRPHDTGGAASRARSRREGARGPRWRAVGLRAFGVY